MTLFSFSGTVYFHVGQHKTGTTSLQRFFSDNYAALLKQDTLYPRAGRLRGDVLMPMHHPLILSALDNAGHVTDEHTAALHREIVDNQPAKIVISSEVLSRYNFNSNVFLGLQKVFPAADRRWIVYLRRQDDLLESKYQEEIKGGKLAWPQRIDNFFLDEYSDHYIFMDRLQKIVGSDILYSVLFDKYKRYLLRSFLDLIDVAQTVEMVERPRENERLPWRVAALLRYANSLPRGVARPTARGVRRAAHLAERWGIASWLDGRGPLSETDRQDIMARYARSNRELCRRYFTEDDLRHLR